MRSGLRYARHSPPLRATLVRGAAFFVPASCRLGAAAAGRPSGARRRRGALRALAGVRRRRCGRGCFACPARTSSAITRSAAAGACLLMAVVPRPCRSCASRGRRCGELLGLGLAWIAALSTLNVSAQTALPDWVRARGLLGLRHGILRQHGAGHVHLGPDRSGTSDSPALSGRGRRRSPAILPTRRWGCRPAPGSISPRPSIGPHPLTPMRSAAIAARSWSPSTIASIRLSRVAFLARASQLSDERRRDGAFAWGVFEDAEKPGRYLEYFLVESGPTSAPARARHGRGPRSAERRAEFPSRARQADHLHFLAPASTQPNGRETENRPGPLARLSYWRAVPLRGYPGAGAASSCRCTSRPRHDCRLCAHGSLGEPPRHP